MSSENNPDTSLLQYYYPEITLHLNQFEKTFPTDGYIQIPFLSRRGTVEPNLVYQNKKYKTTNIFLHKKKYNFDIHKEYDGECIIEHVSLQDESKDAKKVYVCFPLIQMRYNAERNAVDDLIAQSDRKSEFIRQRDTLQFFLNQLITSQPTHRVLTNREYNIFIFKDPIYVSTNFDTLRTPDSSPPLFSYMKNNYREITAKQIEHEGFTNLFTTLISSNPSSYSDSNSLTEPLKEPLKEGYTVNNQYIKTDGLEDIIRSIVSRENEKNNLRPRRIMEQVVQILIFFAIFAASYIISPILYNFLVIDVIDKTIDESSKVGSVTGLSTILFLFIMALAFHILFQKNATLEDQFIGVWIFIAVGMFIITIGINKLVDPEKFSFLISKGTRMTIHFQKPNFVFISTMLSSMSGFSMKTIGILIGLVVYYLLTGLLIGLLGKQKEKELLLPIFQVYLLPFMVLIAIRFSLIGETSL